MTTVGMDIAGFYTDLILINEATNYGSRRALLFARRRLDE